MIKNKYSRGFTPFVVIGMMVFVGVILVGFNQFGNKQLASPTCTTQADLDTLLASKNALDKQIADVNAQITTNNEKIVSLQASLVTKNTEIRNLTNGIVNDTALAQKKKQVDDAYTASKTSARWVASYNTLLTKYNQIIKTNNQNKQKLATKNGEKKQIDLDVVATDKVYVELNTSLDKLLSDLTALNASITSAEASMCPQQVEVEFSLVSVNTEAKTGEESSDDVGTFTIKFKVKAVGDDVYVSSVVNDALNFVVDRAGVPITSGIASIITNVTDSDLTTSGNYLIEDGVEETFELITSVQVGGDVTSGLYKLKLTSFNWGVSDNTSTSNTYSSDLDSFKTNYLLLN